MTIGTILLNLNIPVFGQYAQWVTPIDFLLLHTFFARKEDIFQKSAFLFRAYNERMAHMIGIRYVVTDADDIPGGIMVYQQMAGDTPLRLFRIDGTNLGQYSPTRAIHITTAAEGLAALKSALFDPQRDVLVEQDVPADLAAGYAAIADGRKRTEPACQSDIVRDKPSGPTVRIQPLPTPERNGQHGAPHPRQSAADRPAI